MQGVPLGRSCRLGPCSRPSKNAGFTLIELLAVIGVMIILITLLVPSIARTREAARRTKCTANLKNLGAACQRFAGLNAGRFPMCYRMRDTSGAGYPYYTPFVIGQADEFSNDAIRDRWQIYGTSWAMWQSMGVSLATLTCPSSSRVAVAEDRTATNPEWGSIIWSDYMYVGGLTSSLLRRVPWAKDDYSMHSVDHWGTAVPAVSTGDQNLSERVLAADMVFYSGGRGRRWDITGRWVINHPRKEEIWDKSTNEWSRIPDFQNVLYGDGHVASRGDEDFHTDEPLNTDAAPKDTRNYSMIQANTAGVGGYMYWGLQAAKPIPSPLMPAAVPTGGGGGTGPTLSAPPPLPLNIVPPPPQPPAAGPPTPVYIGGT